MKKILTSRIFIAIITAIICITGSVYATSQLFANQIDYRPEWKKANGEDITNVKDAIDELYNKVNNYQVTVINPSSKGVFDIPSGVTTAYIMFLNATNGNQEYIFNVNGSIIANGPTKISTSSSIDVNLWSSLVLYKVELSGDSGTITCTATGADGTSRGYQISMFY